MKNRGFDFGDFEITKREILASISIIAVMLLIGFVISGKISNYILDQNEKYNKAIKIESSDLFEYGMRTNVGYAFVYGDLKAVDTVSYPEINGEYMYIEKKRNITICIHEPLLQPIPKERHIPEQKLIGLGIMLVAKNKDVRKLHF